MPWEVVEAMSSVLLVEGCNMRSCMSFLVFGSILGTGLTTVLFVEVIGLMLCCILAWQL